MQLHQTQRRCKDSTHAFRDLRAHSTPVHIWPQFSPVHETASCAQRWGIEKCQVGNNVSYFECRDEYVRREYSVSINTYRPAKKRNYTTTETIANYQPRLFPYNSARMQLQQTQRRCKDSTNASRDLLAHSTPVHFWPQFSAAQNPVSWCQ